VTWRPHPGPQTDYFERDEFEVLFGGSAGPGKTDCLIWDAARHITYPRYHALLLRRTFPQLQEVIDRCWEYYPLCGGKYRATEHRWYFPSGAKITLGHMQHEDSKYNYQGKEFSFVGFDELTQFTETQYLYLFSRCRSTDPHMPTVFRSTTNPGGIGHLWAKERFVDVGQPRKTHTDPITGLTRVFIPAKIDDNPTLIDNDPGYLLRLQALPEIERKRLMDGDWEVFEGQVFSELAQRVHGCEPFEIPPEWERFQVLDWGFAKPFSVGWYAVDYDNILYRYREWYGLKKGHVDVGLRMVAGEVANGILEREEPGENIRVRLADPSCWNKQPQNRRNELVGQDIHTDFIGQGVPMLKADNDRIQGIQQVHKRFALETDFDNDTGEIFNEYPRVQIFNNCEHFWRTVPSLQADKRTIEDVDTRQEDHVYDEFRYACMFKPIRPVRVHAGAPRGSFQRERAKLMRARKYARAHGVSLDVAYVKVR
jgi:hypothetical protein